LYFRLNVLPLKVPPLRERPEDIPELVRYFSDWFPNQEHLPYRSFSVSVQNRLRNHSWPGNVRELRNVVQRLLVMGGDTEVSVQEIEDCLGESAVNIEPAGESRDGLFEMPLREAREQFERDYLIYQLKKAGGSVGKLSESVGMERTHLYRKLRSLGIDPKTAGNS
jgi:DNA-binding NtrC family response regulator